jgi:uncharacterized protein (DUF1800 family)
MARTSSPPRVRYLAWLLPLAAAALLGAGLEGQPSAPNIQVLNGTANVPLNSTVGLGSTAVATARPKTFTVKNTGSANLLVSEAITVPQGVTLMASFPGVPNATLPTNVPAFTIAPGHTATFTVALNAAAAGTFSGTVSLKTNVSGKNPFTFTVTGKATPPPAVRYVDDRSTGFTATPGWSPGYTEVGASGAAPFQQYVALAAPGTGTETATWGFTGLEPGQYKVSATWVGYAWAATDTPLTVCDGTTPLGTVRVDQTADAAGFNDGGSVWQDLGTFTLTGSTLAVTMSDDADAYAVADGVRIEWVGYPGQVVDDAGPGFSTPAGTWYPGFTQTGGDFQGSTTWTLPTPTPGTPTAIARWTFRVTPGTYRVMATWYPYTGGSTNAPYTVYDNATDLTPTPVRVNQTARPTDLVDAVVAWKDLGFFTLTGTTLTVQLSNDASGFLNADAVRVERVNTPTSPSAADTVRFLEQATWGPTPALIAQVQGLGFNAWLNQQFTAAATSYPTLPLYNTNNKVTNNTTTSCYSNGTASGNNFRTACLRDHYSMYPLQNRFFTNALYGPDQLRQRVAWTWHRIWVISGVEVTQSAWMAPYLQILSKNEDGHGAGTLGNYRTLMYNVTLNAGMGRYLNMAGSRKAAPNENYPREVLQLFTIGLFELNPDGSQKLDGSSQPIPTYDQTLIDNMRKVFTGWNYAPARASGIPDYIDPMRLNGAATENPLYHDFTAKHLLRGFVQPARTSSVANAYLDLNEALDNIYSQPSLAPFICKQLIQSLVTSNPSPAYVARVVDTFTRNKTGANQMRTVVKAILLDPEARGDRKTSSSYGHLKEPVLYLNNLMRLFGARSDDLTQNSDGYLNPKAVNFGQDTFRPPSVFSYYSPFKVAVGGNPPVLGPEFQLQNTTTALARINFTNTSFTPNSTRAIDVVQAHGTTPAGNPTGPLGTAVDVSFLLPYAGDPPALVDQLDGLMMHGTMTAALKTDVVNAVSAVAASNARKRVHTAVYLVANSSQYQVQQ